MTKWKSKIALVTGCYDFIGSHMRLSFKKILLYGLDNLSSGKLKI